MWFTTDIYIYIYTHTYVCLKLGRSKTKFRGFLQGNLSGIICGMGSTSDVYGMYIRHRV